MTILQKTLKVDNTLITPDAIVLSDTGGTYGIKRADNDAVVVANDTAMTLVSEGVYQHEFVDPEYNLTYDYSIKITIGAVDYYITGQLTGLTLMTFDYGPSYVSLTEMNNYFEGRLDTIEYDAATNADKLRAAAQATKIIDRLHFHGEKADSTQETEFPRGEEVSVPQAVKDACCEIVTALLSGVNVDMEYDDLGIKSHTYLNARTVRFDGFNMEHIILGIPSRTAWTLLKPYVVMSRTINLHRVS
jgi:hypothetical protein